MEWYSWTSNTDQALGDVLLKETLSANSSTILEADFSLLDLKYVATRDIKPEEELTLNYGVSWTHKFSKYLASTLAYQSRSKDFKDNSKNNKSLKDKYNDNDHNKPTFRHFIEAPVGLFPQSWEALEEEKMDNERTHVNDDEEL